MVLDKFLMALDFKVDNGGFSKFTSSLSSLTSNLATAGAALTGFATAAVYSVHRLADAGNELHQASLNAMTSANNIESLSFAFESLGMTGQDAVGVLENMANILQDASQGGEGGNLFARLGISFRDASGNIKDTSVALTEVSAKLKQSTPFMRNYIISQMGLTKAQADVLMKAGEAQAEYNRLIEKAGFSNEKYVASSNKFVATFNKLSQTIQILGKKIGQYFMDYFGKSITEFQQLIEDNFEYIANVIGEVVKAIIDIVGGFLDILMRVISYVGKFVSVISSASSGINYLGIAIKGLIALWAVMNAGFLATPLGMVLSGLALLALLLEDMYYYRKHGSDSALFDWDFMMDGLDSLANTMDKLSGLTNGIDIWGSLKQGGDEILLLVRSLTDAFGGLFSTLTGVIELVTAVVSGDWASLKNIGARLGQSLSNIGSNVLVGTAGVYDGAVNGAASLLGFGPISDLRTHAENQKAKSDAAWQGVVDSTKVQNNHITVNVTSENKNVAADTAKEVSKSIKSIDRQTNASVGVN